MSDYQDRETFEAETLAADRLAKKRASLAKAREAKKNMPPRVAQPRTADDVRAAPAPTTAERAEPAREVRLPEEQLTRRRRDERAIGVFDIPARMKKQGWDYQYIAIRVFNQPVDSSALREFRDGGWRPVLGRDMPELTEPGSDLNEPIEAGGQRLYCRPMSLTQEAKQEDYAFAQAQQRDKMMAAASGKGDEGIPNSKGVRRVPVSIEIEGVAG